MSLKYTLLIAFTLAAANITNTAQGAKMPLSKSYWTSSAFLKDFNGSYRINASIEPVLSGTQRAELIDIQSLMAKGNRTEAIRKLKASKSFSSSAAIQFNLANILNEEDKLDDAIKSYQAALKILPSFRRAHQNIAYSYFKKSEYDKAFPHLIEAVKLGGQDGSVYGLLAHCYQQKDQYEQALVAFRNAQLTQPEVMDWKIGVGYSLDRLGRSDEALAHFERLAKEAPESTVITIQLANLYITRSETLKAIVKLELLNRRGVIDTTHEILLGTLYLSDRNSELGAKTLRRAIGKEGFKDYSAALQAVRYSLGLSQTQLASDLHALVKADDLNDIEKSNYRRLEAEILLKGNSQSDEALLILKDLVKSSPTDTHSLYLIGKLLIEQGRKHEALIILEQAVHSQGDHSQQALLKKSELLVNLERYKDAILGLNEYLKTNTSEDIITYRDSIQRVVDARHTVRK